MFITFEGIDGSGKSTQAKMLADYLTKKGIDNVLTREPGGTPVAEKIREILLNNDLTNATQLALILAARSDHVNKLIEPALENGKWVICDRFVDSTLAYQSHTLGFNIVLRIQSDLDYMRMPNLTFLLDLPVNIAFDRIKDRSNNKYDFKEKSFYEKVRNTYNMIHSNCNSKRIKRINVNNLSSDEVHAKILSYLDIESKADAGIMPSVV